MIVDKKQPIVSIDYVEQGDHYNCIIRLENGFEAIGRVHTKYRSTVSEEELKHMAQQYAIDYAEMHGYELDESVKEEKEEVEEPVEEEVEEPAPEGE